MKFLLALILLAASPLFATTEFTNWYAGANQYFVARVATDAAGDTFIAGTRTLPVSIDVFDIKLDPSGNIVLYREISGGGVGTTSDMAIDPAGNSFPQLWEKGFATALTIEAPRGHYVVRAAAQEELDGEVSAVSGRVEIQ